MIRKKLGICIGAATISIGGATYLASPAQAAVMNERCTSYQQGYAQGTVDASCGSGGGTVDSCNQVGNGFEFYFHCN